jgi:hypothetical protein
LARFQIFRRL